MAKGFRDLLAWLLGWKSVGVALPPPAVIGRQAAYCAGSRRQAVFAAGSLRQAAYAAGSLHQTASLITNP